MISSLGLFLWVDSGFHLGHLPCKEKGQIGKQVAKKIPRWVIKSKVGNTPEMGVFKKQQILLHFSAGSTEEERKKEKRWGSLKKQSAHPLCGETFLLDNFLAL